MKITPADFLAEDFDALLALHLREAHADACSAAFGKTELMAEDIQMFEARNESRQLLGFAALKSFASDQGEIKSVRTHPDHLRQGVSRALMAHIEMTARSQGLEMLCLETHPTPAYAAAVNLYEKLGYVSCGPFGHYTDSPNSFYMRKTL